MNKTHTVKKDYKSIISVLFGRELPIKNIENQRVIMDDNGNISINYSNPEVLRSLESQMRKFEKLPLSKDLKQAVPG